MVDISPKALRFARLAAEQQAAFAHDIQVAIIREKERTFAESSRRPNAAKYVDLSYETAQFCLDVLTTFLDNETLGTKHDWQSNDLEFMDNVARAMQHQLTMSGAAFR